MSTRVLAKRAVAALSACFLVGACGGETTGGSSGKPDPEATLTVGQVVAPSSLDPHRGVTENDLPLPFPIYDRITDVDADGKPVPMLAEAWQLNAKAGTFTLKMRPGVTFSDGAPVDAAAVKANIERILEDPKSTIASQINTIIKSVDVIDATTARLNLIGPGGSLPTLLASRPGMLISPDALENPDLDQHPVGAGAFELISSRPGSSYNLERRTDYWDKNAYQFAKLNLLIQVDTATRLNSLRAGESMLTSVVGPQIEEVEDSGLKVFLSDRPSTSFARVYLNTSRSEFGSKEVRQALNLAIDRETLSKALYSKRCEPSAQPYPSGYFARASGATGDAIEKDWGNYDPERARKLLKKAGLPDGFTFTAAVPSLSIYQNNAQVVQQNLADIGITMKIEVMDATQSRAKYVSGGADALIGQFGGATDPSLYAISAYTSEGGDNPGGLTTTKIENLVLETQRSSDVNDRAKVFDELMSAVFEMGPQQITLCHSIGAVATQQTVDGYEFNVTGAASALRTVTVSK